MKLAKNLDLDRCPHCGVAKPNLSALGQYETQDFLGSNRRLWKNYFCSKCGGIVSAYSMSNDDKVIEYLNK